MATSLYLSLVFHNHQPVGQFEHVNEHSVRTAYEPFMDLMERHPAIKCGVHFTGSLLDYLIEHQQPLLARIRALVTRGQLEVLSGGYYEPILATLPDEDKLGQITKLSRAVEDVFGMQPRGMWLAERVWEPHLVRPIARAGIDYVIIDDTHFEAAGYNKEHDLFGYFVSEEQGDIVRVFPTLSYLRYAIPWDTVPNLMVWLREQAGQLLPNGQPKIAFMGDDGEKFGVWPGTWEHNWGGGQYMETLFSALEQAGDWLQTIRPCDYMDQYPALGRVYLPTASYFEMGQWSLPPGRFRELKRIKREFEDQRREDVLRYLRGSIWRNFMVKYDEVNQMHKRMLVVAEKVHAMPPGPTRERVLDLLWRAQANDAYWHGLFGGVYLFNFRIANYANLIEAETLAEGENPLIAVHEFDFDKDSLPEIVMTGGHFNAIWKPGTGGALLELDYRPARVNLLNVMTRREEGYHDEIRAAAESGRFYTPEMAEAGVWYDEHSMVRVKEPGIERYLINDWYRRGAFIDHFLHPAATLDQFYRMQYGEQGDFVNLAYETEVRGGGKETTVTLTREGKVWVGDEQRRVQVRKEFTFQQGSDEYQCRYTVRNLSGAPVDLRFAVELASGFDGGQSLDFAHFTVNGDDERQSLAAVAAYEDVSSHTIHSVLRKVALATELSEPCALWTLPLETVTMSEAGFERGYQGTVTLHVWPLHLEPDGEWQGTITQSVSPIEA